MKGLRLFTNVPRELEYEELYQISKHSGSNLGLMLYYEGMSVEDFADKAGLDCLDVVNAINGHFAWLSEKVIYKICSVLKSIKGNIFPALVYNNSKSY